MNAAQRRTLNVLVCNPGWGSANEVEALKAALDKLDAQREALVSVRDYADMLSDDEGVAEAQDIADDLYAALNGQGVDDAP
jgi:hypothetical protein